MRYLRWLLIIALLLFALRQISPHFADFKDLIAKRNSINYLWLIVSGISILAQYVGDGWLSQILLKIAGFKIKLKETIKIASIDVFAAHLLPIGEAGTFTAITYFYKKLGVPNHVMIFLTVTWAAATNTILIIFLLISVALLPKLPSIPIHISSIIIELITIITIIFVFARKYLWQLLKTKFIRFRIFKDIITFINNYPSYLEKIRSNKFLIIQASLAALIYYIGNIASLYFAFLAFGNTPQIALITFAYLMSLITTFITLAPAGIGASEATMILIFHQFGVNPAIATAAVLIFRLFAFWLPIPAGALSYWSLKNYKEGSNQDKSLNNSKMTK